MNQKITLRYQELHIITAIGWAFFLILGLFSRGVISNLAFWLVIIPISILFILDAIYFVARVSEGHYLFITEKEVLRKRFFKPIETIEIAKLTSIVVKKLDAHIKSIFLSDQDHELEIKHDYKLPKESILFYIKESSNYPRNLEIIVKEK